MSETVLNEPDRLAALRRHGILDTPPERSFERIVAHVQSVCRVPIALVSLVDANRQWFKAKAGVDVGETSLDTSVCALAIRQNDVFEIEDLRADERTAGMSLVTEPPFIRFYAGAPLITREGAALGSLCAIDTEPRLGGLTDDERAALKMLADQVVEIIEMRSAIADRDRALASDERALQARDAEVRYDAIVNSAIDSAIISFDDTGVITSWSRGAERILGWSADEMIGDTAEKFFTPEDRADNVPQREFETARATGRASDERWHVRKDGVRIYSHGAMTPLLGGRVQGFVKALRDVTAEHDTRSALSDSREKLELATQAARMGQFDFYPQTGELEWDDRCRELFGISPGVPVSYEASYLAGLHPEDRGSGADGVLAALDPAGSHTFDLEYRTVGIEDGIERHIHAKGSALFEGGMAYRLIGTVQDVTADRKARLALRETAERLRLAGRATNDAIWDWDVVANQVTWNAAIESAYGHPLGKVEPTGNWWLDHIHPEDRARVDVSIHSVIDGDGTDWNAEYRFRRADGSYAEVLDRGYVLRNEDGSAARMIGAMFDQTDRKRIEQALRQQASGLADQVAESRGEIERLWASSPDLLLVIDFKGVFQRVNPAWTTLLGYDPEDLIGHHINEFVLPDFHNDVDEALEAVEGGDQVRVLNRYRHKYGEPRWFSWVAAPSGDLTYATGRDVTAEVAAREALRRTEEALRQSQKVEAVGQLTGGVAHDFNNLLTVIRGSVDLLRRPDLAEEKRTRYIDAIADTAERATRLTSQLLAFARRSPLKAQTFDAKENLAALASILPTLTGSRMETIYDLGHQPHWVRTDPSQFDTAIINMAVNARDAMAGEGTLTIGIDAIDRLPAIRGHDPVEGRYVAISIADTGGGIAKDKVEHIFEPFFTTKDVGHGTGLGLSQVFGFAKQSHGNVAVLSEVDRGTIFTLYLPQVEPAVTEADATIAPRALREGACVLVVEDNREVGEFAKQALTELGYDSIWRANATEALASLAESPDAFDIVFTDVVMPGRSGIELAAEIHRLYPTLPVVLASGYSDVLVEHGSGGLPLVHKPYSIDELAAVLRTASEP